MKLKPVCAVITGDLINSSKLSSTELKTVRKDFLSSIEQVAKWRGNLVWGKSEFFRGDSWQMVLTEPGMSMRVALFLRASLKAKKLADTRMAIGIGAIDSVVEDRVSLSSGEAFVLSGRMLDELDSHSYLKIGFSSGDPLVADWVSLVVRLCDVLTFQWKPSQAKVVTLALCPFSYSQEKISERLKPSISRQAVSKALRGAHWSVLQAVLQQFEETEWDLKNSNP